MANNPATTTVDGPLDVLQDAVRTANRLRRHLDAVLTFAGCDHDSRDEDGDCIGCRVRDDAYAYIRGASHD